MPAYPESQLKHAMCGTHGLMVALLVSSIRALRCASPRDLLSKTSCLMAVRTWGCFCYKIYGILHTDVVAPAYSPS